MKIQITLAQSELKSIVARHLNLPNGLNFCDLTVTVSAESDPNHWDTLRHWNEIGLTEPHRKIEAVKSVRTAYPGTSLAEAKYAVEVPWSVVKYYVDRYGSLAGFVDR
jgi:hypothetical protein